MAATLYNEIEARDVGNRIACDGARGCELRDRDPAKMLPIYSQLDSDAIQSRMSATP